MRKLSILLVALMLLGIVPSAFAQGGIQVTYTSGFNLQNLGGDTAQVIVDFYNANGDIVASMPDSINAGAQKIYYPLSSVPDGFAGSAVVSSSQPLAAIVNVLGNVTNNTAQRGDAYAGFTAGGTAVNLPLIMKNNYGIFTWFNVQNTGSNQTTVTVKYSPGTCTEQFTIKPGAAHTFDQAANTCLGASYIGAANITADQPLVATVMQVSKDSLLAYNGFTDSATSLVMPSVQSNYYKAGTSVNIQNTGAQDTVVELSYTPSAGFPGKACKESHNVPAGQAVIFGWPQMPAGCGTQGTGVTDTTNGGFVGSAKITGNSTNQKLVAIVNQVTRGAANGSAYDAINPAKATAKVSMPLIMDRNYGLWTGFSIANVGAQATTINCTFTNAPSYTVSKTLQPGEAVTEPQLNKVGDKYAGAGTCTASGGDALIAGVVNERYQSVPTTVDAVYSYNAFNY